MEEEWWNIGMTPEMGWIDGVNALQSWAESSSGGWRDVCFGLIDPRVISNSSPIKT